MNQCHRRYRCQTVFDSRQHDALRNCAQVEHRPGCQAFIQAKIDHGRSLEELLIQLAKLFGGFPRRLRNSGHKFLAARIAETAAAENVLRIKGFVEVSAKPMRLQVQAVGSRVNHYYDRPWAAGEQRRSRLVIIGEKGINREKIEQMLAA